MYLIILFLYNPDLLEEVLKEWEEAGVENATVQFSTGMERVIQKQGIRDDIPLIPSLDDFYEAPGNRQPHDLYCRKRRSHDR
ncbi:MAG: hypothetical protein IPO36_01830 [Anaerolineales bacterium]|nr:hypothetical protein [Anaerolineales bacterium]